MLKKRLIILVLVTICRTSALAQWADSLEISTASWFSAASQSFQPLWTTGNRHGVFTDQPTDFSTTLGLNNQHVIRRDFYIKYEADLYVNDHFSHLFFEQAYLKMGYKKWEIRGGRFYEVTGDLPAQLSSGSWGVSGNALPIPKVGVATTDFVSVPFTHDWLQFMFSWEHGWMDKDRYVKSPLLHEKSLYLRIGKETLSFSGGFHHFVLWGGKLPNGTELPHDLDSYLRVIVGASAKKDLPIPVVPGEAYNALGDHRGIWNFGIRYHTGQNQLRLYTQSIFDKGVGAAHSRDKLTGLKIFDRDRLVGLWWKSANPYLPQTLVEYIYSKYQGGLVPLVGRDNYYNNFLYRTGWQYENRIIGTPLFFNQQRARHYFSNTEELGEKSIVNNRVVGIHAGFSGKITTYLAYRTLLTLTKNYGNYYNTPTFTPPIRQFYGLMEFDFHIHTALHYKLAMALDAGGLSRNAGLLMGLQWKWQAKKKSP